MFQITFFLRSCACNIAMHPTLRYKKCKLIQVYRTLASLPVFLVQYFYTDKVLQYSCIFVFPPWYTIHDYLLSFAALLQLVVVVLLAHVLSIYVVKCARFGKKLPPCLFTCCHPPDSSLKSGGKNSFILLKGVANMNPKAKNFLKH